MSDRATTTFLSPVSLLSPSFTSATSLRPRSSVTSTTRLRSIHTTTMSGAPAAHRSGFVGDFNGMDFSAADPHASLASSTSARSAGMRSSSSQRQNVCPRARRERTRERRERDAREDATWWMNTDGSARSSLNSPNNFPPSKSSSPTSWSPPKTSSRS